MSNKFYCYILASKNENYINKSYNGMTNNLSRRIRQHNGEIKGGAKYTRGKGPWKYIAIIEGYVDKIDALCCEWRIKHPTNTRTRPAKYNKPDGRINSLNIVLTLDKWTNNALYGPLTHNYTLYLDPEYNHLINTENIQIKNINELIL